MCKRTMATIRLHTQLPGDVNDGNETRQGGGANSPFVLGKAGEGAKGLYRGEEHYNKW